MSLHGQMARYPWRFGDGRLVKVIADSIWWRAVVQMGRPVARYPWIVGRYHSHPGEQAEFRHADAAVEEEAHLRAHSLAVF
jgi:proteasome lid subunit RPN8/RPN11